MNISQINEFSVDGTLNGLWVLIAWPKDANVFDSYYVLKDGKFELRNTYKRDRDPTKSLIEMTSRREVIQRLKRFFPNVPLKKISKAFNDNTEFYKVL